jgi:hypothetical protein
MIAEELRQYLEHAPRGTAKRLAEAAGMDHAGFSNRLHEHRGMRFNYEQIGAIADAIGAPPGWPLVKWNVGEALATVLRLAGNSAAPPAAATQHAPALHPGSAAPVSARKSGDEA